MKSLRLPAIAAALALIAHGTLFGEDPLAWLNAARRSAGLPAVQDDSLLARTAQSYAGRLAARGALSHRGRDGSGPLDRYRAMGGSEVRVGEILGAGPTAERVQDAWLASPEHRALALDAAWTHAGWGSVRSGGSLVMVMMFTSRLVDGLSVSVDASGMRAAGRFVSRGPAAAVLLNGLEEIPPEAWDPASRAFRFSVPAAQLEGYIRLGYRTEDGGFTLTNAFTLPRPPGH